MTALEGDPDHPITRGVACSRGRRIRERTESPDRILHPLKKVAGRWQRISWDQAIDEIAGRIQHILATSHHHAILHVYDWGSGTLLKNLNQRFFYELGGCSETVGSLCWDAGLTAQTYDFGQARSHSPQDLANARRVVVWGRNLSVTNMHMVPFLKAALASGAQLAVVNPLPTDLDGRAALCVHPRPGTDGALALGVLRVCRDNGWLETSFLQKHSVGWDEFAATLELYTLEWVSQETEVPAATIVELARWYGTEGPVATLLGIGLQRYAGGGNAIRAIDALAAATGQVGVAGGGVNFANRWMTEFLNQAALEGRDGADVREFTRGGQAAEILRADPPVELMFITRTNPVVQVPDTEALVRAYRTVPTIVAIDQFMTPSAELADYFLPCTTVLEEEDISLSTMWHPYITYAHRVIPPRGEARPDHEIFGALAEKLGFGAVFRRPLEEWFELSLTPLQPWGVSLDRLKRDGTVRLPLAEVPWVDFRFRTPSGHYEFASETAAKAGQSRVPTYVANRESRARSRQSGADYPYALLTIHPRTSQNSQHRSWPHTPEFPTVYISPDLAAEVGVVDGGLAQVRTDRASVTARVAVRPGGHPYTVMLESGWWNNGRGTNHLTPQARADFGVQTAQYDCACAIRPV